MCGLARTTNAVEGWHLGVTALFQGSHPSIYTFLEKNSTGFLGRIPIKIQHFEGIQRHYQIIPEEVP